PSDKSAPNRRIGIRSKSVMRIFVLVAALVFPSLVLGECRHLDSASAEWTALDRQYATIERAILSKDAKLLFSMYAPDFEAHQLNGQVWKFNESAAYSIAAFDQVKENISVSNTIVDLKRCARSFAGKSAAAVDAK